MQPHIVLTTFGSLGDLHPYLAVGLALRERGAQVTVATSELYRDIVVREGLRFHPVRPDMNHLMGTPEVVARALHPRTGGHYILKKMMLPVLEQSYEDLLPLAREADLLVSHPIAFATPIAADVLKKKWAAVVLQPLGLLSVYDPPTSPAAPFLENFRNAGPNFWRMLLHLGKSMVRRAGAPINKFRRQVGVPPTPIPIFDGMQSPYGTFGWFPSAMSRPQPDWPAGTRVTGYPFFDEPSAALTREIETFLQNGPPPVVFTMGSAAVFDAGSFYRESARAAELANKRAILLIGRDERNRPQRIPDGVLLADYAPYGLLFPHASAIVHQGGIGTTAQSLRAGHPSIIVPYSHDQPDNARRARNLGCAEVIPRTKYRADIVAAALKRCESRNEAARSVADLVRAETGASTAADLLLKV